MKGQHTFRFDTKEEALIFVEKIFLWEMCVAMFRDNRVVHVIDGTVNGCSEILYRLARNSGAVSAQLTRSSEFRWDDDTPTRFLVSPDPFPTK